MEYKSRKREWHKLNSQIDILIAELVAAECTIDAMRGENIDPEDQESIKYRIGRIIKKIENHEA